MMRNLLDEFSEVPVPAEPTEEGNVIIDVNGDVHTGEDDANVSLLENEEKESVVSLNKIGRMGKRGLKAVAGFIGVSGEEEAEVIIEEPRKKTELELFFELVSKIRERITIIQQSTEFIKEMTKDMQEKTLSDSDALKRNRMFNKVITKSNKLIQEISESVKGIKQYNDAFSKAHPDEKPLIRIRANIYGTLCKNFRETVNGYTNAQESQKRVVKEKLVRQYGYISNIPREKIEEAVDNGENVQAFKNTLSEQAVAAEDDKEMQKNATQALAYVENKHNEIVALTNSVKEVHQLFEDLARIVENQGEIIDDIEENCREASEYVEKGVENLQEARVLQKKARKKMFWLYGLILAIFGVVIIGGGLLGVIF